MGRTAVFMMCSVDGYVARQDGAVDWHVTDEAFESFANRQLEAAEVLLLGRVTYELLAGYWPTATGRTADLINGMRKVVFSNSLRAVTWAGTTLVHGEAGDGLAALKAETAGELLLLGSSRLAAGLLRRGLVDEVRVMVNPVVLGGGQPLLVGMGGMMKLRLTGTEVFESGNVLQRYQPADGESG